MNRVALGMAVIATAGLTVSLSPASPATASTAGTTAAGTAAGGAYDPDTCRQGFVWREARPFDHVCVAPEARDQAAQDNRLKAGRWVSGPYGPHTCVQGYVWREAFSGDDVCVTPEVRTQTRADNAAAAGRRGSTALPSPITLNRNVTFSGGVPVGGWTSLTLYDNGTYQWSGHIHDSGATSYNFTGVCVVRLSSGSAFVFETAGRLHGTFDSGSRDHNWSKSSSIPALSAAWRASASYNATCKNSVSLNLTGTIDSALQAVGYASQVIAILA
ncbi:hypothetical protein ACOZ38_04020 [Sphaerisporangium viridialbum]|uniref:hypothetical protein n=1 Tax=Sphaerisporangium viridialbum TaxID=46189 RepID=UPI003C71C4A6